jgi:SHS family lactate transporter-like MFS transporter
MITCLSLFVVLELGTGFTKTLPQFLAVRSLYGIAMGGLFGPAAATALEDLPYEARGILSGLFEQGYATGYLLAAIFFRALVPTTSHGWRSLFWFGAGPPILIILFRMSLPETNAFQVHQAERIAKHQMSQEEIDGTEAPKVSALRAFAREFRSAFARNVGSSLFPLKYATDTLQWFLIIYMVVLMSGFNATSHGSQDFYPTYLQSQLGMDPTQITVITVVGQIGALIGAMCIGYISTFAGRRLTMLTAVMFGGAILPAYVLPKNMSLVACAFFEQFFVGGVWGKSINPTFFHPILTFAGPIPIHLLELSPPALRSLLVGFTYQLGNLASSASATIQAIIAERFPLPPSASGAQRYNYGKVIGIFMGAVWAYDFFWLFMGPEMTQAERDEEAEDAKRYEILKKEGMSLREIGSARARGEFKNLEFGGPQRMDVESKGDVAHIEDGAERIETKDGRVEHIEN